MAFHSNLSTTQRPDRKVWLRRLTTGLGLGFLALCGLVSLVVPVAEARPAALGTQSVIINEVAWMGTGSATTADEWIELYNPGAIPIDLTDWTLRSVEASPSVNITFNGQTISPGGYFLLERTDETTVPSVTADYIYTGDLANAGEFLELRDNNNVLIDTANSDGGSWPQGIAAPTYCSMERIGPVLDENTSWVTSPVIAPICGSPKAQNSQFITPTATPPWLRRILINEVAWGGTQADDTLAQWIELYNPGPGDVDLTGIYLRIPGKGDIALPAANLAADDYYLIERNEVNTSEPSDLVIAFPLLDPAGDSLYLYAPGGELVDSANADGGPWPAGSRFFSYTSMERRSNEPDTEAAWLNFDPATYIGPIAQDRLGNFINGSPGTGNSPGATSTPTFTPSPTLTSTVTQTPTITPTRTATGTPTQTLTPAASMSVIINEVAWMGTSASTSDEWIELYNPSATNSINLSGWRLETTESGTKSLSFTFTDCTAPKNCIIPPQGYLLLERTDDATVSDIAADQFFTGSLPNSGSYQSLRLYSNTNQLMDKANSNGGNWPAGSATTYCTMERRGSAITDSDSAWITNTGLLKNGLDASGNALCGTPKNINWAYYVTPTPTPAKTSTPIRTPTKSRTPTPNRSTPEPVVINEFLPHARSDWNGDGLTDSGDEFIELINLGAAAVSLNNYKLDDQEGDSAAFIIKNITIQPGTRVVFFASQTGLLLGDGGDSVRLYKSNGQLIDAYTYDTVKVLERSWCRLPDGKFSPANQPNWVFGCEPSPNLANLLAKTEVSSDLPLFCLSPRLPQGIYLAECDRIGLWNWNQVEEPLLPIPPVREDGGSLFIFE